MSELISTLWRFYKSRMNSIADMFYAEGYSISWNVKRNNAHRLPSVGVAVLLHDSGLRCKKPCQRGTAAIRSVVLWLSRRLMLAQPCVGQYVARSLGRRVATTRRRCLRSLRMQAINLLIERDSLYTGVGVRSAVAKPTQ